MSIIRRYSHQPQPRYQYAPMLLKLAVGGNVTLVLWAWFKGLSASSISCSVEKWLAIHILRK